MNNRELIDKYVSAHAECRWMDASDLRQLLNSFADELRPQLPSGLDEAAEEYSNKSENHGEFFEVEYEFGEPIEVCVDDKQFVKSAFKAGAEWMAGQFDEDAYEEEVQELYQDNEGIHCVVSVGTDYNPGDKVIVQIRKV